MSIGRSLFSFDTDEDFRGCFDDDDPIGGINFSRRLAVVWVAVGICSSSSLACVRFDGCLPSFPIEGHGVQDRVFLEEQITWRVGIVPIAHIVLPQLQFKAIHERSKKGRKRKQKNNNGKGLGYCCCRLKYCYYSCWSVSSGGGSGVYRIECVTRCIC